MNGYSQYERKIGYAVCGIFIFVTLIMQIFRVGSLLEPKKSETPTSKTLTLENYEKYLDCRLAFYGQGTDTDQFYVEITANCEIVDFKIVVEVFFENYLGDSEKTTVTLKSTKIFANERLTKDLTTEHSYAPAFFGCRITVVSVQGGIGNG